VDFAENFEDLKIWQRVRSLANEVYDAMAKCRDFDFRSQIQRAATSVMNNRRLTRASCHHYA
jgi:four helix bundle protein